ncbi:Serine phosphatase RsbU, regulator of sigma subunit [[Actinomadura] parvosata subsp. kistnae]|uniref:Histidine kinase n=1 Tax=[Actinomadura] parvosata subsp. kistnae TaxID=1909395 RepID=A0A1V0A9W5_9ACTN|nr:SpoIIE family protein phosphatase [Nonomuraea sp. ATCC 55076]AQZ66969.1 histidine kinase [Nonomuraea sp. ATCC 55076]SPL94865.1 Serine phosphatase RsbU, regulator of sigma subunit [Actinomadura parvosata subsp. kistnae]
MKRWGDLSQEAADHLAAGSVLDHAEMAVVVTDRFSNLLYWNPFAEKLFGRQGKSPSRDTSVLSLGIMEKDHPLAIELAKHVLKGGVWEGTFDVRRGDGTIVYVRAQAVPLRPTSGAVTGIVIMAREALRSNEREKDRFGLLERIGERLAGSLYVEETLKRVAEMLVPQFADHCFIELMEGDRLVRRVSQHVQGWTPPSGTWKPVGAEIRYPSGHYADTALRRQETILVEDFATNRSPSPHDGSARLCGEIGMTSAIVAPLLVRGETLGLMYLGLSNLTDRRSPHYDAFDRDFVGAIATRVALAIDNALLFEEERHTAESFQKYLLPRALPQLDGLDIAVRYYPAAPLASHGQGIQTQVGGDWYDVIPLSAGRVGIVIGDVEGRGAKAAAIMGQLRAALRAFAQDDKSPADILARLDEWTRIIATPEQDDNGTDVSVPPIVTCQYLVYDAWSRQLSFANAGHAAPLLLVDGQCVELDIEEVGQPLGVRAKGLHADLVYKEETRTLPPGAALLLYTDGLVDRRPGRDGRMPTEAETLGVLCEKLAKMSGAEVERIADAATVAVPGEIDDDMAILVVRSSDVDLDVESRTFPAQPIMVGEARRMAAEAFASWNVPEERAELACLLVSEVVTNVVLHAATAGVPRRELVVEGPPLPFEESWDMPGFEDEVIGDKEFTLRLRRGEEAVWVEVFDQDLRLPRIRSAGENDEGGRGLYLVDQLARRWGSRPTREGKAVWFEIPTRGR